MPNDQQQRQLGSADLVLVDDILPSDFSPFRTIEYAHYLKLFDSVLLSREGWRTWDGDESFDALLERLPIDADLKERIVRLRTHSNITAKLAYVTFLHNAIDLMPYFESRNLPFIFQLYPGGGFEINSPKADVKLRKVLTSPLCRRVIVTQRITERYIVDRIGYDPAKITHIFGGVFESRQPFSFARDKLFYPRDKPTIDLCFVAHKYLGNITSKGYDQFIAIARGLAEVFPHLRFHVVGDYLPDDIPLCDLADRFTFHGRRSNDFFRDFYRSMDAIISINRPFDLLPGSFDGFPTGACIEAGFHGVLNCINDPLDLNPCLTDGQDIVMLDFDHARSIARLGDLLANPAECYRIAEQGFRKFHEVFDTNRQLDQRTQAIAAELTREEAPVALDPIAPDAEPFERALLPYRSRIQALEAAAGQRDLSAAQNEADLQRQVARLSDQVAAMTSSTSWRVTRPLRHLSGHCPGIARLARRGLKLAWWTVSLQLPSRYRARAARQQPIQ